ncbi:hypothetical protein [Streptomyces californicus]|uniref:hypothetical protein n=1 Tax=Streptomyces californicus TaxID=67351 RepID=UPI0036746FBA
MVANVTEERDPKATGSAPIDVQTISRITDEVLKLQLNTSTHEDITAHAQAIHGALNLLVREELGADEDSIVRDQIERAYRVLDVKATPPQEMPAFSAFAHMREAASVARRLLWIWAEVNGVECP